MTPNDLLWMFFLFTALQPVLKQRFLELGSYTRPMTPSELSSFFLSQQELWRPIMSEVASLPK